MKYLALDIGTRHTGVAYLDTAVGIPLPLDTVHHQTTDGLLAAVVTLVRDRSIDEVVVGMPLLPSGEEGAQADHVKEVADQFRSSGLVVQFVDERYTTPTPKNRIGRTDGDATAACQLLASLPLE